MTARLPMPDASFVAAILTPLDEAGEHLRKLGAALERIHAEIGQVEAALTSATRAWRRAKDALTGHQRETVP